jgi:hypothetical protein
MGLGRPHDDREPPSAATGALVIAGSEVGYRAAVNV